MTEPHDNGWREPAELKSSKPRVHRITVLRASKEYPIKAGDWVDHAEVDRLFTEIDRLSAALELIAATKNHAGSATGQCREWWCKASEIAQAALGGIAFARDDAVPESRDG